MVSACVVGISLDRETLLPMSQNQSMTDLRISKGMSLNELLKSRMKNFEREVKTMAKKEKRNWTEEIANKFIDELKNGKVPWVKPWVNWTSWSRNTGNDYKGVNQLVLTGGEFLTFNQIREAGGHLNKGSKGEKVVYYSEYMKKVVDEETGEETRKKAKFLKAYTVFRVSDTDLKIKHDKKQPVHEWDAIEKAEQLFSNYCDKYGVKVIYGSNQAYNASNSFGKNEVVLPERTQFKSAVDFYKTVFHELVHSTSVHVGRDLSTYHKSKKARAREELVAEIGSAYIMAYLGVEDKFDNSVAYVQSWAKNLEDDKAGIMYATPKAIEGADLILGDAINESADSESESAKEVKEEPKAEPKTKAEKSKTKGKKEKKSEEKEKPKYKKSDAQIIERVLKRCNNIALAKVFETSKGYLAVDGYKAYLLNEKLTDADYTEGVETPDVKNLLKIFDENPEWEYTDIYIDKADLDRHIKEHKITATSRIDKHTEYIYKFENNGVLFGVNPTWFRDMLKLLDTNWIRVPKSPYRQIMVTSDKGKGVILPIRVQQR